MKNQVLYFFAMAICFNSLVLGQKKKPDCKQNFVNHIPVEASRCDNRSWELVFEDDFDGNGLDLSKWHPYTGVPRDPTFENEKAWHKPENIVVENGILKIISKNEQLGNMPVVASWNPYTVKYENFDYSTGEIWTNQRFGYGKFEARVKTPSGRGVFPAF